MKLIQYFPLLALASSILLSCQPDEPSELGRPLAASDLKFSVTQEEGFDNKIMLTSTTPNAFPQWEYKIGAATYYSTDAEDTVIFVFPGDYWIKYRAYGSAGASVVDSVKVTVTQLCIDCITDEDVINLTDKTADGKKWKLVYVGAGAASSTTYNDWGSPSWWSPSVFNWDDRAVFDLDNAFNYTRIHADGTTTLTGFNVGKENLDGTAIPGEGRYLEILGDNQLMVRDGSNQMADQYKNRYHIYKLTADTMILGQGGYYTTSDKAGNWSYFHWYVRE